MTPNQFAEQSAIMEQRSISLKESGNEEQRWYTVPENDASRAVDIELDDRIKELSVAHTAARYDSSPQPRSKIGRAIGSFVNRHF